MSNKKSTAAEINASREKQAKAQAKAEAEHKRIETLAAHFANAYRVEAAEVVKKYTDTVKDAKKVTQVLTTYTENTVATLDAGFTYIVTYTVSPLIGRKAIDSASLDALAKEKDCDKILDTVESVTAKIQQYGEPVRVVESAGYPAKTSLQRFLADLPKAVAKRTTKRMVSALKDEAEDDTIMAACAASVFQEHRAEIEAQQAADKAASAIDADVISHMSEAELKRLRALLASVQ